MLDPRAVFAAVFFLSSCAIVRRRAEQLLPFFVLALVLAVAMRLPFRQLWQKLRRLWQMIALVALLQGVFNPSGRVLLALWGRPVLTLGGLLTAAAVVQRMAILIVGGGMLARYRPRILVQGMVQLGLPYELATMVSVGIRFIPLAAQTLQDSLVAMQLRGIDHKGMPFRSRMRIYTYLLLPTIAGSVYSARQMATAMELRGFGAHPTRTSLHRLRLESRDLLFLLLIGLLALATAAAAIFFKGVI